MKRRLRDDPPAVVGVAIDWSPGDGAVELTSSTDPVSGGSIDLPGNFDAVIPVRVPEGPRSDGYVSVYLPDGTAFEVSERDLLRPDVQSEPSQ